jgi:hypothetical protein
VVPTISNVSQPCISSQLGRVPSRPIDPVTNGRSSGSAALPSKAFAAPAPNTSQASISSRLAPRPPAPISSATREPALSSSAARSSSAGSGCGCFGAPTALEKLTP